MSFVASHSPLNLVRRSPVSLVLIGLVLALSSAGCANSSLSGHPEPREETVDVGDAGAPLAQRVMLGAFTYGGVWRGMEPVLDLETEIGRRLDIVHWFTNWNNEAHPEMSVAVAAAGRLPLISWQPHQEDVRDIADGAYDDYLRRWARDLASVPTLVYLRPFPEMNGDWVSWNGDPEGLVLAWRHMVALFDEEGASNVRWVFSPNVTDEPRVESNRMELYYPGADVVDVLALDGYNWGTTRRWTAWRPFEDVFANGYARITSLGGQPVWFAEMASAASGGDKAQWVLDMLESTAFPRLEAVVWFDEHKEADWRMVADPRVADAFRTGLTGPDLADASRTGPGLTGD